MPQPIARQRPSAARRRLPVVVASARLAALAFIAVVALAACGASPDRDPSASEPVTADASPELPSPSPPQAPSPSSLPSPSPSPTPTPSPSPSPSPVPAPLTGQLVSPDVARRKVIAVMIDDLGAARPQSGFTDASVVWHAPAEGGIPRYMLLFQEGEAPSIGPVRSARDYYVAWAAEWNAVYVHGGGSPGALRLLRSQGNGQLVWDADEFRWGGRYLWRSKARYAPHNVYTDSAHLRALQKRLGADDPAEPPSPVWRFAADEPLKGRPVGGRIEVVYPYNTVTYGYDRASNTYPRSVTGEKRQMDAGTDERVAPKNVVVMVMSFSPLRDGTTKKRLEADYLGDGPAWIATNGRTVEGTWRKTAIDAPTTFYDAAGEPVILTVGQTFVQVMPKGSKVTIADGRLPAVPRAREAVRPA